MQVWRNGQIAGDAEQLGNVPIIHHYYSLDKREKLKPGEMCRN
jgi:hypothetical protein